MPGNQVQQSTLHIGLTESNLPLARTQCSHHDITPYSSLLFTIGILTYGEHEHLGFSPQRRAWLQTLLLLLIPLKFVLSAM